MELVGIWRAAEELAVFVTGRVPAGLFREERVVTPLSVWWLPRRGVVRKICKRARRKHGRSQIQIGPLRVVVAAVAAVAAAAQ
jgi:hypothetical protein